MRASCLQASSQSGGRTLRLHRKFAALPITSCKETLDCRHLMQATEAESRMEYAVHYGIPYPRLHHASQFAKRYVMDRPQMPNAPHNATG